MRGGPMKVRTAALILAGIYAAGVVLGVWLIGYMPSGMKRARLTAAVYGFAAQYVRGEPVDDGPLAGAATLVFGRDGALEDRRVRTGRIYHDFEAEARRSLPRALRGEDSLRLVLLARDNTALGYTSLICIAVPLFDGGEVAGAFVWFRELRDLLEAILGFWIVFTCMFALAAVFMGLSLRRQYQVERLRRRYIDNITHELKAPVAAIKALAEALSDGVEKGPEDRSVYYGMILREANRQERMICDVLELSRLQSAPAAMARRPAGAEEVFGPVCEGYASLCDLMGISFTVSPQVMALPELMTDPKYISTVLDVLLSNAVKFAPEGACVSVSARAGRARAVVCVEDSGKGISQEEMPHIFERFYKGSRSDNEAGSGLGLAIAKEIADGLHEKLWIRSREGEGTQAYFTVALRSRRPWPAGLPR